jgi:hypothetical protein
MFWRADPLLDKYRESSNETTAVAMQLPARQWTDWKAVFSARSPLMAANAMMDKTISTRSVPRGYKPDKF